MSDLNRSAEEKMKIFSVCFVLVLLSLAGCSDEPLTLFDGKTARSKTEKGEFTVRIALRVAPLEKSAETVSLDALLTTARSELKHYTDVPDKWEFVSITAGRPLRTETIYQVLFGNEWNRWIMVVVAADGTVLGRPEAR